LTNQPIAATTNAIGFNPSDVSFTSCTIDPSVGPGSPPDKQLSLFMPSAGTEKVVIGGNTNLIPGGLLCTCQFMVNLNTAVGSYALANTASAQDPTGAPVVVDGAPGTVTVTGCTGDCDSSGAVSIGEVTKCVNLFLGQPLCSPLNPSLSCPVADANLDGTVSIGEITQCINNFLRGCPP
jgi:hypothetical protein